MTTPNYNRGNELNDHRQAKIYGRRMMLDAGFEMVLCEYQNCDLVGLCGMGDNVYALAMEFERSARHVATNCRRDLAAKCNRVLIVCLPPLKPNCVRRVLDRQLDRSEMLKIQIISRDELTVAYLKNVLTYFQSHAGLFGLLHLVNSEENAQWESVVSGCFGNSAIVTQATNQSQEGGDLSARTDGIQANAGRN